MKSNFNYKSNRNTLYLIPTPIGNLDDITLRALAILKAVDVIFAEDTRVTLKLLTHFDIKKKLFSFHEHNSDSQIESVCKHLETGENVGLVSDAGMPLVSDPGYDLVKEVIDRGFNVVALPGANALLPALAMSGIRTHPFLFYGFLNAKTNSRKSELEALRYFPHTLVFYEAIHRIDQTIADIYDIFGDRDFCIAREISKAYEEIIWGRLSEIKEPLDLKGELVLVVSGYEEKSDIIDLSLVEQVDYFVKAGLKKTEAMKRVAEITGIPKNIIYNDYLKNKLSKE